MALLVVGTAVLVVQMWSVVSMRNKTHQVRSKGGYMLVEPIWWIERYLNGLAGFYCALAGRRLLDRRWGLSALTLMAGMALLLLTVGIALGWAAIILLPVHTVAALYILGRDLRSLRIADEASLSRNTGI